MEPLAWMVALWVDVLGLGQAPPAVLGRHQLERVNRRLHGRLLDFTHNHGADRRIWSAALGERRDLYVYLPPGFDPARRYPLAVFLHGAAQDEQFFLQTQAERLDRAIAAGLLPPLIVAAPDGSFSGRATLARPATFWATSRAGDFEGYVMGDVWGFVTRSFPILPEREAHALMGVSMGGAAAFTLAIKHRDRVRTAIAFMPPLNLRYVDCRGDYHTAFDPECFALRERIGPFDSLGRRRLFSLRFNDLFAPMFGRGTQAIPGISDVNPLEVMERCDLRPGELDLYVAYGGKDELNIAAQVDSFLYFARRRGVEVEVDFDPNGRHDLASGRKQQLRALQWAAQRVPPAR